MTIARGDFVGRPPNLTEGASPILWLRAVAPGAPSGVLSAMLPRRWPCRLGMAATLSGDAAAVHGAPLASGRCGARSTARRRLRPESAPAEADLRVRRRATGPRVSSGTRRTGRNGPPSGGSSRKPPTGRLFGGKPGRPCEQTVVARVFGLTWPQPARRNAYRPRLPARTVANGAHGLPRLCQRDLRIPAAAIGTFGSCRHADGTFGSSRRIGRVFGPALRRRPRLREWPARQPRLRP